MKKTVFASIAALGALGFAAASADDHKEKGDWEAELEATFTEIDADADGNITADEYMAYKTAEAEKEWAEWVNDDGVVTLESAKATYKAKKEAKKAEMEAEKSE